MARVTDADVKAIIETNIDDLTPHINAANLMVTRIVAPLISDEATLKEIERWLAAHFVAIHDPRLISRKVSDASDEYESARKGQGLMATKYGQQVLALDPTGKLSIIGSKRAFFKVSG